MKKFERVILAYLDTSINIKQGAIIFEEPKGVNINLMSDYPNYLHIYKAMDSNSIVAQTKQRIMRLYNEFFSKVR